MTRWRCWATNNGRLAEQVDSNDDRLVQLRGGADEQLPQDPSGGRGRRVQLRGSSHYRVVYARRHTGRG